MFYLKRSAEMKNPESRLSVGSTINLQPNKTKCDFSKSTAQEHGYRVIYMALAYLPFYRNHLLSILAFISQYEHSFNPPPPPPIPPLHLLELSELTIGRKKRRRL